MTTITKNQVEEAVFGAIESILPKRVKKKGITRESSLKNDLDLDSLKMVELIILLEEGMQVDLFSKGKEINFVQDLVDIIYKIVAKEP